MREPTMTNIPIDPKLKAQVDPILADLGLSESEAISLFYEEIRKQGKLPFDVGELYHETPDEPS